MTTYKIGVVDLESSVMKEDILAYADRHSMSVGTAIVQLVRAGLRAEAEK